MSDTLHILAARAVVILSLPGKACMQAWLPIKNQNPDRDKEGPSEDQVLMQRKEWTLLAITAMIAGRMHQ
eukprot:1145577-Pelagomonas_calceolata.AAC.1